MFGNIAWSELFIIAAIALVVIGPKELPAFLRVAGRYFGKIKGVADDFKSQFDEVVRETQVNEIKDNILKEVEEVKSGLPSEKDIGLDFSELDQTSGDSHAKTPHIDDEDENLDWDEPDEVIETNADGEVTHHSKKSDTEETSDAAEASQISASEDEEQTKNAELSSETPPKTQQDTEDKNLKTAEASPTQNVSDSSDDDYDFDEDDGALLDEEDTDSPAQTSKEILDEGRQKFKEIIDAEQAEAQLLKEKELEHSRALKRMTRREAELSETNRHG